MQVTDICFPCAHCNDNSSVGRDKYNKKEANCSETPCFGFFMLSIFVFNFHSDGSNKNSFLLHFGVNTIYYTVALTGVQDKQRLIIVAVTSNATCEFSLQSSL